MFVYLLFAYLKLLLKVDYLLLADAHFSLKLSLHSVKSNLQAIRVIRLHLANEAEHAVVAFEHISRPFRLAARANYRRQHTVTSDVGHMSVETLVKLTISALIDTGSGLNKAFPPMGECLIERVHFLAVICLASNF